MTKLQACICVCVSAAVHVLRNCPGVSDELGWNKLLANEWECVEIVTEVRH